MTKNISAATEKRLRAAFATAGSAPLPGSELVKRLLVEPMTRANAFTMIANARMAGLLTRSGSSGTGAARNRHGYSYRLNPEWRQPEMRGKRAHASDTRRMHGPAQAYNGPAFGSPALAPALGLRPADPEVMPPQIADMVASLHQRFFRHGHGVVEAD